MEEYKFHNGQKVEARLGIYSCRGRIVGCATTEFPVIGRIWLVEADEYQPIPNETYPFEVFSAPECSLTEISK